MTNAQRILIATGAAAIAVAGAASAAIPSSSRAPQAGGSPAAAGARFPALARHTDGRIAMVWTERGADSVPMVRMAVRAASGAWSAPSTVVRDQGLFVNFADIPRIAWVSRNELAVSWLQRSGDGRYDYGIRVARSRDGGRTWGKGAAPHDTTERGEHGFVSLLPLANGRVAISFLNGRDQGTGEGATQLAYTELNANGTIASTRMLDTKVCDCCQTSVAATSRGPIVAFRDRSGAEIRDIAVARAVNGQWSTPDVVTNDRWKIGGCPVNGPAIAAEGARVALAWFTAARDTAKVQVMFSRDGGSTFEPPLRVDGGAPAGHVDVLLLTNGDAIVSWLERLDGNKLAVRLRRMSPNRTTSSPVTLGEVSGIRPSGWPSIVPNGNGVLVAWTTPGNPAQIQVQQIDGNRFR